MTDSRIQALAPTAQQQRSTPSPASSDLSGAAPSQSDSVGAQAASASQPTASRDQAPGEDPAAVALPASAQRVAELLAGLSHPHPIVMLPQTGRTSAEAAEALGCDVANIAKSIIFRRIEDDRPVLVVASGVNRVDEQKVTAQVGAIGRADARFVRDATGYAIGGVCPIGHVVAPLMLIDADLLNLGTIWAAAGHPHAVFPLDGATLARWTGAPVIDIAERR